MLFYIGRPLKYLRETEYNKPLSLLQHEKNCCLPVKFLRLLDIHGPYSRKFNGYNPQNEHNVVSFLPILIDTFGVPVKNGFEPRYYIVFRIILEVC